MSLYRGSREGVVHHGHPLRILACLMLLLLHCVILGSEVSFLVWGILLFHTLLYPHLIYLASTTQRHETRNIILDSFTYGATIAIWGFNPLAAVAVISATSMTNLAAGGAFLFFNGTIAMGLGM